MALRKLNALAAAMTVLAATSLFAQPDSKLPEEIHDRQSAANDQRAQNVVVVTGARFSYQLLEKWIEDYHRVNPQVQILIESRGSADPLSYDILAEVYEHGDDIKESREYIKVARYAILPVANSRSLFAEVYSDKGLNAELIRQIFFHDIFSDRQKQKPVEIPFTVYTRLQNAGVPKVFATHFGLEQKDIMGTAIAGADAHLLKALLRDSTGVTYLPVPLVYDENTRNPVEGLTVIPVDFNGNKKVSDEEKFYDNLDRVIEKLEAEEPEKIKNIPVEYLHLSIDKQRASAEAIDFLKWVNENGQDDLHSFGYLQPETQHFEKDKFNEFASRRGTSGRDNK